MPVSAKKHKKNNVLSITKFTIKILITKVTGHFDRIYISVKEIVLTLKISILFQTQVIIGKTSMFLTKNTKMM